MRYPRPMADLPLLETDRLSLVIPKVAMAAQALAYRQKNREHLAPSSPLATPDFFTESYWAARLQTAAHEYWTQGAARFVLFLKCQQEGPIIGEMNFTQIVKGPFLACYVGFGIDAQHEGKGLMSEALRAGIAHVFDVLKLHRIMANYMPTNVRSARLLRKLGFTVEGYARDYLFLNGSWQDHVLTSLTNPNAIEPS
jgi:[ribosomal protein S5]-alanine N-acetyltransferase